MSDDSPTPRPAAPAAPFADHDALPPGTRFGEFEIVRVLGVGGFGIVYLAQDHSLERQVALKEYMPASLASRGAGPMVTVRSGSFAETYAIGLRSFVNEARLLARFDHPSLVKVYRFWEDNATAYMVMPYLQGITLRDARRGMAQPPDEAWIRSVLEPMLDALEQLHREGVFHRDIAPDNILLPPVGAPILLDFGAARHVISDRTQSLTAILKPSYAPIEQYADMSTMRQGPWTDLYALGAVVHYLLFGAPPAPATARAVQNDAEQLEQRIVPGVSAHFMSVVAWMLGVRPLERPQNVASVRAALSGQLAVPLNARTAAPLVPLAPFTPLAPSFTVAPLPTLAPIDKISLPAAAPAESSPEDAYQPTLRVESAHRAPTRIDTAHQPTTPLGAQPATQPQAPPERVATAPVAPAADAPHAPAVPAGRSRRFAVAGVVATVAAVAAWAVWQFLGLPGAASPPLAGAGAAASGASAARGEAASAAMAAAANAVVLPAAPPASMSASVPAAPPASAPTVAAAPAEPLAALKPYDAGKAMTSSAASAASGAASLPARARPRPLPVRPSDAAAPVAAGDEAPPADNNPGRAGVGARNAPPPTATNAPHASAREACGSRVFIALALCMERECDNPRFRDQPECARLMEIRRNRSTQ